MEATELYRIALKQILSTRPDINQGRLADMVGMKRPVLNDFIHGRRNFSEDRKEAVAKALGTSYTDMLMLGRRLVEGAANKPPPPPEHPLVIQTQEESAREYIDAHAEYYRGIPLYKEGSLSAGTGGFTIDENEPPESTVVIYQQELLGRSRHDLRALRVGGDSMWPVIPKNSIVVVDLSDREFTDGKIYAVREPETDPPIATVKRIRKGKKGFVLVPENRAELPEIVDIDWHELVIGRVVWMWRDLLEESKPQKS